MITNDPNDPRLKETKPDGQQVAYLALSEEERAKGFVRPVRRSYKHVGLPAPTGPMRDLTPEEHERYDQFGYVQFETYPKDSDDPEHVGIGKYWKQAELDRVHNGCQTVTSMGTALAETYARDPRFYSGTYCCWCKKHFPVQEFVWDGTDMRVGS